MKWDFCINIEYLLILKVIYSIIFVGDVGYV